MIQDIQINAAPKQQEKCPLLLRMYTVQYWIRCRSKVPESMPFPSKHETGTSEGSGFNEDV
jgi:hypothetical protein